MGKSIKVKRAKKVNQAQKAQKAQKTKKAKKSLALIITILVVLALVGSGIGNYFATASAGPAGMTGSSTGHRQAR